MTDFQAGWYKVQRKLDNTLDCRFFDTPQTYIAHCWLETNGSLRLWWDARKNPPAKTMTWEPRFQRIADPPSIASWDAYSVTYLSDSYGFYCVHLMQSDLMMYLFSVDLKRKKTNGGCL